MNGWPARSAASRKPHPKYTHPGRGAFCAPAVFAAGEMRLNGSKGRGQRARYHAKLRLPWSRARTPALVGFRLRFASQKRAAGHRPRRGRCFAVPVTAAPRRGPNGKTPALVGFRLRFASQKRAAGRWPHRGQRARYHAKLRLPWPRARTPALVGFRLRFASQKRAAGHRPRRGRCFGLPHFRFAQAWPLGQNPGA